MARQLSRPKSIGNRIKSAHTYQSQEALLLDWAKSWEDDFKKTHELIRQAIRDRDTGAALRYSDQMTALSAKKFDGLEGIIRKVCDPKRILKDNTEIDQKERLAKKEEPSQPVPQQIESVKSEALLEMVARYYKTGKDVNDIAIRCNISSHKTIKLLVTAGIFHGETYDKVSDLRAAGKTEEEICNILNVGRAALDRYTPYKKGIYRSENPTENALRIRKYREDSQ